MAQKKKKKFSGRYAAKNRRARRDYAITETIEAGLALLGTEVKSLRAGRASINEAYAGEKDGELWLYNAHIPVYDGAGSRMNHEPHRARKLLLHRRQINNLIGSVQRKGMSLVPLSIYFNKRGIAKAEIALGEGKRQFDKRQTVKQRDWDRQKARLMRDKG